jgi:hypothetical protein
MAPNAASVAALRRRMTLRGSGGVRGEAKTSATLSTATSTYPRIYRKIEASNPHR